MRTTPENLAAAERWERLLLAAAQRHPREFVRTHGVAAAERCARARRAFLAQPPELDLAGARSGTRQESWESIEDQVGAWQDATFPAATPHSAATHLAKEIREVLHAVNGQVPHDALMEEVVDCWFLLLQLRRSLGVTPDAFRAAVMAKLAKNKARTWGKPDDDGVVEHVRNDEVTP